MLIELKAGKEISLEEMEWMRLRSPGEDVHDFHHVTFHFYHFLHFEASQFSLLPRILLRK